MIKRVMLNFHSYISKRPFAATYLDALSFLSRHLFPRWLQLRAHNSFNWAEWPPLQFHPRTVLLGNETALRITPHLGEFDALALFSRKLDYEYPVFVWLEQSASNYKTVIEIGANIGIFTVFLDALSRRHGYPHQIIAFEPSPEAFRRLTANLYANKVKRVVSNNSAIGATSGIQTFYEPFGHLTNGSFDESFARLFSEIVHRTEVRVFGPGDLEDYFQGQTLVKIDVEGYEPTLLTALSSLLQSKQADVIIEVLPITIEPLRKIMLLDSYKLFLITDNGPILHKELFAHPHHRDWLFVFQK